MSPEVAVWTASVPLLLVLEQHQISRHFEAVGVLGCTDTGFTFRYLDRYVLASGTPLPGFPDLGRTYVAGRLFPLFSQRVMDSRRPDYQQWMTSLALPSGAPALDVLSRTQGHRLGDAIRLVAAPAIADDGQSATSFFVHGLRHRIEADPTVESEMSSLRPGDQLQLAADQGNEFNPLAVHVASSTVALGWVPDVLAGYAQSLLAAGRPTVTVLRANPASSPPNQRLLVRVEGSVEPDFDLLDGFGAAACQSRTTAHSSP